MWELLPLCVGGPGTLYKLHPSTVSQWYVPYRFRGSPQWERLRVAEAGGGERRGRHPCSGAAPCGGAALARLHPEFGARPGAAATAAAGGPVL